MKTPSREWSGLLRRAALLLLVVGLAPEVHAAQAAAPAPAKPQRPKKKQRPAPAKKPAAAAAAPAAEEVSADEQDMFALDAQLEQQTQVASYRARSVSAAPAIVTLVEREELQRMGARDLMDVLYRVPGFFFGVDVGNVVGVGFRGNWGHEGKVLLLVDGQELNEGLYSTLNLGNHFPVDHIERVEVIRGPGSVQYGGNAELAVVNVITRAPEQLQGGAATLTYGQLDGGFARRSLSLAAGHLFTGVEGLSASVSGTFGEGQRSGRTYTDAAGQQVGLAAGNARLDPRQLNLGVRYRDLQLRLLYDDFQTTTRDGYDLVAAAAVPVGYRSLLAEARHDLQLSEQLTLTTRLNLTRQQPWQSEAPGALHYNKHFARYRARLLLGYAALEALHLAVGVDLSHDRARLGDEDPSGLQTLFGGERQVDYTSVAALAEAQLDTEVVSVVAGARLEHHGAVGSSFVPRVALMKQLGRLHAKALLSSAFRAPSVENLNANPGIRPERTRVLELEAGYALTDAMSLSANAFDIRIGQPIVYAFDPLADADTYRNFERSGTRGAELEYALQGAWGRAQLSYSLYTATGEARVPSYATDHPGTLLGLPNHRASLAGVARLPLGLTLAPTLHLFGARTRVEGTDGAGAALYAREPTQLLANLFLQREDAFVRGLTLGAGLYNAFGTHFRFVQPYDGGHAPLPGHDRELLVRANYTLPF